MILFFTKKQLADLESRVTALERTSKQLDLEWSNTYDKFRSILGRIAKRHDRLQEAEGVNAGSQEDGSLLPREAAGDPSSSLSHLTPRQAQIQAQIMKRRARGGVTQ